MRGGRWVVEGRNEGREMGKGKGERDEEERTEKGMGIREGEKGK